MTKYMCLQLITIIQVMKSDTENGWWKHGSDE